MSREKFTTMLPEELRRPKRAVMRARSLKRAVYWRLSSLLSVILIAEFPKSGGTWLGQMLADVAGYKFPRNNLPPSGHRSVLLGHHLHSPLYRNVCVLHRDGRDVMVSAYHHFLVDNEWNDAQHVALVRKRLGLNPQDAPYTKFNAFLAWMFEDYPRRLGRFSWAEFVRSWDDRHAPVTRYESMLANPTSELARLCNEMGLPADPATIASAVEKNSFQRQTGRKPGEGAQGSFARKAVAGDWKAVFDSESRQLFDHYAGAELIHLGYEPNRIWVADKAA